MAAALGVLPAEHDEIPGPNPELGEKAPRGTASQGLHFLPPRGVPTTRVISDGVEVRIVFEGQEFGVELLKLLHVRSGGCARPSSVQQEGHEEDREGESLGGRAAHRVFSLA